MNWFDKVESEPCEVSCTTEVLSANLDVDTDAVSLYMNSLPISSIEYKPEGVYRYIVKVSETHCIGYSEYLVYHVLVSVGPV